MVSSKERTMFQLGDYLVQIGNKPVICFGFGEGFKNFIRMMRSIHRDIQIEFLVDNAAELQGRSICMFDREYKICPFIDLVNYVKEAVIVITVLGKATADEIRLQIENTPELEGKRVIWQRDIVEKYNRWCLERAKHIQLPDTFRKSERPLIPKVIHYCWFGGNPVPEIYLKWMESWKQFCPDYEIVRWDESNYDVRKNPYMKSAYEAGKWAFVSDYARLDIIYHQGGIYLDTDVELLKPLDDFLFQDGFAGYQLNEMIALGLGFGARPQLPVIGELLADYDTLEFMDYHSKHEQSMVKLCSDIQTEHLLRKKENEFTNSIVDMDGLRVYPAPVLCGLVGDQLMITEHTYSIHHFHGSWVI